MESTVPGQKVILTLSADSGPWTSSIWPSELVFTREFPSKDFILNVTVPDGTSTSETHVLTINGHWVVDPGINEGDMAPFTTGICPRPYSAVNLTIKGEGRKTASVGEEVDFTIIVRNVGNCIDHYLLTVACDGECHAWTEESNITVFEKGSSEVVFTVYQDSGPPGTKSFIIHAVGIYAGSHGHDRISVYLDTKFGVATLFVEPWGLFIIALLIMLAVAVSFILGRWALKKRRIMAIRRRRDHA